MATETITHTLSASVGAGGSFTVAYPAGKSADDYVGSRAARIHSQSSGPIYQAHNDFTVTFGATISITILRNRQGFVSGDLLYIDLDIGPDQATEDELAIPSAMDVMSVIKVNLGAPIASDSNGAVESQACTLLDGLETGIDGELAADGVATLDVPRNVVAAWTGTAVLTVTGTDVFGNVIVESSASGTSLAGKKAFKTVTGVSTSADITGLTVGTSKVLGLPTFLADVTDVLKEAQDGAAPTAGTVVAGDENAATATTGDVRGTYAPNAAPDGSKVFELLIASRDPRSVGFAQYAG